MKKLMAVIVLAVAALWATSAFADYASLGDDESSVAAGVGGIYLSGNDATGASQSEFLPTVNISGLAEDWAWQVFYAFGSDASAFGGNVDYILADNFDECATCDDGDRWWFGVGPTLINYDTLFADAAGANSVSDTDWGANLGVGWEMDDWSVNLYAHYLVNNEIWAAQGSINWNFN
jgi:hypothetical protein